MFKQGGHNRHSIRLKEYDYSEPGFYFITICVRNKQCILGEIISEENYFDGAKIKLSKLGKIINEVWLLIPEHHNNVELDEFVIMPNHIHGIVVIRDIDGWKCFAPAHPLSRGVACNAPTREFKKQPSGSLATIVGSFKSATSKIIRRINSWEYFSWQRNYYEHIIRDEKELNKIRNYIINNPLRWFDDPENPYKNKKNNEF